VLTNKRGLFVTTTNAPQIRETIRLAPSFVIPLVLAIAAIPLLLVQVWIGLPVEVLGLFLLFQSATIRLEFTQTALDIYRSNQRIRQFPYQDWSDWEIFWPPVPILFYFREVNSIHFLPILFNPKMLQSCLEERCPRKIK
jgi:hypothetical protein